MAVLISEKRFDTWDKVDDFSVERPMKVRIVHNPHASVPLPREVFNAADDEQVN